jgi:hypothetical protein
VPLKKLPPKTRAALRQSMEALRQVMEAEARSKNA